MNSWTTWKLALRCFDRLHLKLGESKTVAFTLTPEHLMVWNRQKQRVFEAERFKGLFGASFDDIRFK